VHGWDVDPQLLAVAHSLVPEAVLEQRSALHPYLGEPFDLVIGNPPYFQFRAPPEIRSRFAQVISGRPNIFALFFQAGLEALTRGGRLAYVVPPSMNNGAYFQALRAFIMSCGEIDYLDVLNEPDLFENAQTAVQLIVVRTGTPSSGQYAYKRQCDTSGFERIIFTQDPDRLASEFRGRRTLWEFGYEAVTGTIVWNQHREHLSWVASGGTLPLIWAHNIHDGELLLDEKHSTRPQYIVTDRPIRGPAIVVNRIVGAVGSADLRCAIVPAHMNFVGENHVNVIRARSVATQRISWTELLRALLEPEVGARIRLLTGNTQVSATELNHLVPLADGARIGEASPQGAREPIQT